MIIILAYHSISDKNYKYAITPENFRWQLRQLKKRFKIIGLDELDKILKEKEMSKDNYAVVTFDDGLEDNYLNAFTVLKELKLPATIFITTCLIGKDVTNNSDIHFNFLNWEKIHEMDNSGLINFQAHTHTHPNLTELSEAQIADEFRESKVILEKELKKEIKYFAYPKGFYNEKVKNLVKKEYNLAFAGSGVITKLAISDRFLLPRVTVENDISKTKFILLLNPLAWMLKRFIML